MSRRIKNRQKKLHDEADEELDPVISSENFVDLNLPKEDLPYLKSVDLIKLRPHHFDLDKWRPTFRLPNAWMKRIYKHDVYRDTDFPDEELETITQRQRKILNDYVTRQRRSQFDKINSATKTRQKPPIDCLLECLERPYVPDLNRKGHLNEKDLAARRQSSQGQPLALLNSDNIAICSKHKIQPEEIIVRLALEKMKDLSLEEEQRYQQLLKNKEFMQELNNRVESYLKGNSDSHSFANEPNQQQHSLNSDAT